MSEYTAEQVEEAIGSDQCTFFRSCREQQSMLRAYAALLRERESVPQEKGATHCDNCGLTWLDDGLNPIGCPYCKDRSAKTSVPKGSLQELLTTQIDGIQPDFRVAVQGDGKGGFTHIIIHPFDHDGDTLDFWVRGDRLYRSNDPAWEDLTESGGLLEAARVAHPLD